MGIFLAIGAVDILGRVLTLLYMMRHSGVRCLTYRTWVLLTGFLNFAFVFYWILACPFGRKAQAQPELQHEGNCENDASNEHKISDEQER